MTPEHGFTLTYDRDAGVVTVACSTGEEFTFRPDGPGDAAVVVQNFITRQSIAEALTEVMIADAEIPRSL